MTEYIQVMTTVPGQEVATRIAELLIDSRLAGCVQIIGPVTSVYRWQGKVETGAETMLLVKSRQDLFSSLAELIIANHPYEVPEILAVPVVAGGQSFLDWLSGELRD
jgi:periplasmic divalent cation tolerance protein